VPAGAVVAERFPRCGKAGVRRGNMISANPHLFGLVVEDSWRARTVRTGPHRPGQCVDRDLTGPAEELREFLTGPDPDHPFLLATLAQVRLAGLEIQLNRLFKSCV